MIKRIAHVAIATRSMEKSLRFFQSLGLEPSSTTTVDDQKVRVAVLPAGDSAIELVEPVGQDSPIERFLENKGDGLHHISLEVKDILSTLADLKSSNVRLIDEEPRRGAEGNLIAFVHPQATGGVLVELQQRTSPEEEE